MTLLKTAIQPTLKGFIRSSKNKPLLGFIWKAIFWCFQTELIFQLKLFSSIEPFDRQSHLSKQELMLFDSTTFFLFDLQSSLSLSQMNIVFLFLSHLSFSPTFYLPFSHSSVIVVVLWSIPSLSLPISLSLSLSYCIIVSLTLKDFFLIYLVLFNAIYNLVPFSDHTLFFSLLAFDFLYLPIALSVVLPFMFLSVSCTNL